MKLTHTQKGSWLAFGIFTIIFIIETIIYEIVK